ncbi:hypothetical protein DSL92_02800 [Billgrantia gudaonensis]|uniref:SPOR domain-containing protein n=1 Tax=Billgrantia gudaonensis TaxID=376427 RepID=A0A3S0NF24_9GAMM|nr:hypothetical protein DSL92_02800 [Halomonas gudaonensis]
MKVGPSTWWLAENRRRAWGKRGGCCPRARCRSAADPGRGDAVANRECVADNECRAGKWGRGRAPLYQQSGGARFGRQCPPAQGSARGRAVTSGPVASGTGVYRVQVGPLAHAGQVAPVRDELRRAGFPGFIVKGTD